MASTAPQTPHPYAGAIPTVPDWNGVINDFEQLVAELEAPKMSSADWWSHVLVVLLSVAAFVGGVIHPGFHIPTAVSASVGSLSVAAVAIFEVVQNFTRARTKQAHIHAALVLKDRHLQSLSELAGAQAHAALRRIELASAESLNAASRTQPTPRPRTKKRTTSRRRPAAPALVPVPTETVPAAVALD